MYVGKPTRQLKAWATPVSNEFLFYHLKKKIIYIACEL